MARQALTAAATAWILAAAAAAATGAPRTAAEADVMRGFPPAESRRVTLTNWDSPPFNRWAFAHMDRVVPTAAVWRGPGPTAHFARAFRDIDRIGFEAVDGSPRLIRRWLRDTYTDALLILHRGKIVSEQYFNDMTPQTPHMLHTATEPIIGALAGVLVGRDLLDIKAQVTRYIPELQRSGYDGATIDNLLTMTSGAKFAQDPHNPTADNALREIAAGRRPPGRGVPGSVCRFLLTLPGDSPHGAKFTYRPSDTDVLGWAIQRASARPLAELVSEEIWAKLGAEGPAYFTVDPAGMAVAADGFCCTLRDLGRFAQTHLAGGAFNDRQVVPRPWIDHTRRARGAKPAAKRPLPGGAYYRGWWVRLHDTGIFMARGAFGQLIYIDATAEFVVVKFSSWPNPENLPFHADTLRAIDAIRTELTRPTPTPASPDGDRPN